MRHAFLPIALFIAMAFTTQAQVFLIPKAGLTATRFAFKQAPDHEKADIGFTAGAALNLPIGKGNFSIQPEISYIQKNYSYKNFYVDNSYFPSPRLIDEDVTVINKLIEVPILAKYTFGTRIFKAYLNLGPSVGYWFSGKRNSVQNNLSEEKKHTFNSDMDNRLDVGIQGGGGLTYQLGPGSLVLDVRYGYGLTNYAKKPGNLESSTHQLIEPGSSSNKSQSRTFAFTLGYQIPLASK